MSTKASFKELINGEKPVLVDFSAEWCGPCQTMKPILEDFKRQVGDKVVVLKVDIDRNPKAAQAYQVRGVPTFAIFKQGKVVWRKSGVMPANALMDALEPHL